MMSAIYKFAYYVGKLFWASIYYTHKCILTKLRMVPRSARWIGIEKKKIKNKFTRMYLIFYSLLLYSIDRE